MILVCRDCGATVKFGENCGCGGIVELSKTQMDDLLQRAWKYQTLETYYRKYGLDVSPDEILRVSVATLGTPAENADLSEPASNARLEKAGSLRR
jgi:hypothetical protein